MRLIPIGREIPLVTSLPPVMARRGAEGSDIGPSYQQTCIDSWIAAGFAPVTVNSEREAARGLETRAQVAAVVVESDAHSLANRPLVFVHDMIAKAAAFEGTHVAITNADIVLRPGFDLHRLIATLPRGRAVVAHRTDVARPEDTEGTLYRSGFDFFAMHRDDLADILDFGMVFGLPWWDHFLPTMLWLRGVELLDFDAPFVFHLLHDERWRPELWRRVGTRYIELLSKFVENECSIGSGNAAALAPLLQTALVAPKEPRNAWRMLAKRLPWRRDREADAMLHRVSNMTIHFVDERRRITRLPSAEGVDGSSLDR